MLAALLPGLGGADAAEPDMRVARLDPTAPIDQGLVAVPQLLSQADASQYRMVFALQRRGKIDQAGRLTGQLRDRSLMGHVLAQRYLHPTAYRSSYGELAGWLDSYADLPEAAQIHALALKRRPDGAPAPTPPSSGLLARGVDRSAWGDEARIETLARKRTSAELTRIQGWRQAILDLVADDRPTQARRRLGDPAVRDILDPVELAWARWQVARSFFANGKDLLAYQEAAGAAAAAGHVEPGMHWTAGLAAWRLGEYATAAQHFTILANAPDGDREQIAAGAFWAARAYLAARRPQLVQRFLGLAANASDGFYGLLARATAGQDFGFQWQEPIWSPAMEPGLLHIPGARRAIALAQIGEADLAEAEIRHVVARANPAIAIGMASLAEALGLPAAQLAAARKVGDGEGRRHASVLFPVPDWRPQGGFTVDRAMLYALVRAESGFDPNAVSPAGAIGLMQIMPDTGAAMARRTGVALPGSHALKHPETNLRLGQAYIQKLRSSRLVGDSLIHLCLAYNSGLTRLERWMKDLKPYSDDPLLFLESVPVPESRNYAKKVLANLWAYRERLGQPMPSLGELAANAWPRFEQIDGAALARKN